jgi:hypothetical protein
MKKIPKKGVLLLAPVRKYENKKKRGFQQSSFFHVTDPTGDCPEHRHDFFCPVRTPIFVNCIPILLLNLPGLLRKRKERIG